jgi:CubicO group peptidase (beta-lactamase class C family)
VERTTDPDKVGFDPARLERIDRHFAKFVDDGRLAGWQIVVTRDGEVAHSSTYGLRDREAGAPVEPDTLWRIYSMTKPITSVAAMMLWEEGAFELTDEVSRWIPSFADVRVFDKGSLTKYYTVPATEPVRLWHLLTHTSGLTYPFLQVSTVDAIYRQALGWPLGMPRTADLATVCDQLASMPLLFQPGTRWGYGMSTDVLGRVVEVVSGRTLEEFVSERILQPLGMTDTGWSVGDDKADRLAALYAANPAGGPAVRYDALGDLIRQHPAGFEGGGGLVSTAADYHRFTQMLLRGGEVDGVRLLGTRTLDWMIENHLPGGKDLGQLSAGGFAETVFDGVGFGLGFAVMEDPRPSKAYSTPGEFYWGGLASTAFWVDPVEEVTAMLFTQLMPSSTYPLRPQLRQLVYSSLVD